MVCARKYVVFELYAEVRTYNIYLKISVPEPDAHETMFNSAVFIPCNLL